jgi:hypothetical protein
VVRLFDRALGLNLLALACAAILVLAGRRERAKRPQDDLPAEQQTPPIRRRPRPDARRQSPAAPPPTRPSHCRRRSSNRTGSAAGEQLRLAGTTQSASRPTPETA